MAHVTNEHNKTSIGGFILRFFIISIVLVITSFLTPGFSIVGIWSILMAAVVIAILDYAIEATMNIDASPFGKGIKGFAISAIILYLTQFIVPNMSVSIIGAILASLVIGVLDAVLPSRVM